MIQVDFIPHTKQRYDTAGDYYESVINDVPTTFFKISDTGNTWYNYLILFHELREYILANKDGVKLQDIDNFDFGFVGEGEPGDNPHAPYYKQHQLAEIAERSLAADMNLNWKDYEQEINKLEWQLKK